MCVILILINNTGRHLKKKLSKVWVLLTDTR